MGHKETFIQRASLSSNGLGLIEALSSFLATYDVQIAYCCTLVVFVVGLAHTFFGLPSALKILPTLIVFLCSLFSFVSLLSFFNSIVPEAILFLLSVIGGILLAKYFYTKSKTDPKLDYGLAPFLSFWFCLAWISRVIGLVIKQTGYYEDEDEEMPDEDVLVDRATLLCGIISFFITLLFQFFFLRIEYRRILYTTCYGSYLVTLASSSYLSLKGCESMFFSSGEDDTNFEVCRPKWLLALRGFGGRVSTDAELSDLTRLVFPLGYDAGLLFPTLLVLTGFIFQLATRGVPTLDYLRGSMEMRYLKPLRSAEEQDQRQPCDPEPDVPPAPMPITMTKEEYEASTKRHTIAALKELYPKLNTVEKRKQLIAEVARLEGRSRELPNLRSRRAMFSGKESIVILVLCLSLTGLLYFYHLPRGYNPNLPSLPAAALPIVETWQYQPFSQPWIGSESDVRAVSKYLLSPPLVDYIQNTLNSAKEIKCIVGGTLKFGSSSTILSPQVTANEGERRAQKGVFKVQTRTIAFSHKVDVIPNADMYTSKYSHNRCPTSLDFDASSAAPAAHIQLPYCDQPTASIIVKEKWKKFVPFASKTKAKAKSKEDSPWTVENVEVKVHLECLPKMQEFQKDYEAVVGADVASTMAQEHGLSGKRQQHLVVEIKRPFIVGYYVHELPAVVSEVQLHSKEI